MSRLKRLIEQPIWLVFAGIVVAVSLFQLSSGSTMAGGFGILVAILILASILFQPQRPDG